MLVQTLLFFVFHPTVFHLRESILCPSAAMTDTKDNVYMQSFTDPRDGGSPVNEGPSLKQGTVADQLDMQRMGKTQQTKVLLEMECPQGISI